MRQFRLQSGPSTNQATHRQRRRALRRLVQYPHAHECACTRLAGPRMQTPELHRRMQEPQRQCGERQFVRNDETSGVNNRNCDHEDRQSTADYSFRVGEQDQARNNARCPRNENRDLFKRSGRRQCPRNQGGPTRQHIRSPSYSAACVLALSADLSQLPRKLPN
jgi:hypothetical protein